MTEIHFVSDVHLDADRPAVVDLFLDFLANQATRARALYILGDLFEVWIGDDDPAPLAHTVHEQLHALSSSGTAVFFLPGNRDFLCGEAYLSSCGCTLLKEPTRIDLYGENALLMHGDTLCTGDTEYQKIRIRLRDEAWQAAFLEQTIERRRIMAREFREASRRKSQDKPQAIMDVHPDAVVDAIRKFDAGWLIHGHTHRPAEHELTVDGIAARRSVLADWREDRGEVLVVSRDGWKREPVYAQAQMLAEGIEE